MLHRLGQLAAISRYAIHQLVLGMRGKAFPIAVLHNLAWFASSKKKLPTATLEALFPAITGIPFQLQRAVPKLPGNLTVEELAVVALVCQRLKPRAVFEFGTYNGRTTLNPALNTPAEARIHTLDLPTPGQTLLSTHKHDEPLQLGVKTGELWRGTEVEGKIEQLWCDSAQFDEGPCRGRMDLVFVDAAHSYEYVRNDTSKALAMVRPGGVILWHDYCVWYPGVPQHLHELLPRYPIRHIEGTHLAILVVDR